jgi:hypothetical protein
MMTVVAVVLASGRLFAQAQDDPVERDVQRLKDRLTLTDDQVSKVRDMIKKERDDIRSVLTDDQKKIYDQAPQGRNNRGAGTTTPGTTAFRGGWFPPTDELKKDLSLTDDQVTKINAARDGVREEMRRLFQNRRGPGGQDMQASLDKLRDDTTAKMRDALSDEQKPKFDEAIKAFRDQQAQGGGTRGATGGFGQNRGTLDERVARVMEALKIDNAQEAEAIKGIVRKVIEAMDKLDAFQRDSRTKIDEAARNKELSDDAVGQRIGDIHKGTADLEKTVKDARKELSDIVTSRQELELIRRGILR